MSKNWKLIHHHLALVPSIDTLVSNQSSRCDRIGCHAVAKEENDIFGFSSAETAV
jgi:hypothetical protein